MNTQRFIRLPKESIVGFKIATRKEVNKKLSHLEAFDDTLFLSSLKALFGKPDLVGDGRLTYSIRDKENQIDFEAFLGSSGPSYGGYVRHFENISEAKLLVEVEETLIAFDLYLMRMNK